MDDVHPCQHAKRLRGEKKDSVASLDHITKPCLNKNKTKVNKDK